MCRMMRVVTISLCKHSITPALANIPQQSIQSCTPLGTVLKKTLRKM